MTNFRPVPRGTEGAVSVEGTLAGIAAALVYSALALALQQASAIQRRAGHRACHHQLTACLQVDLRGAAAVALAAIIANYVESVLGATLQDRVPWLNNDVINMLQITLGAGLAILLSTGDWLALVPTA